MIPSEHADHPMPSFLTPLLRDSSNAHQLVNERTGVVLAERLLSAFDSKMRRAGLLTYDTFPPDSAMVIAPTNAIHTFFMKFPIDVLFVAKDGRIVKVREALPAWRMAAAWRAHCVIELAARTVGPSGTRDGDFLSIRAAVPPL